MGTAIRNPYYTPAFHGEYAIVGVGRLDLEEGGSIPQVDRHLTELLAADV